jgi:hypothetical protein
VKKYYELDPKDSFFGRSFIDACPLETDPEDMLAASEVVRVRSKDDDYCGLQLGKEALAALEEVKIQEEKERRQKEEEAEKAKLKALKEQEEAAEARKEAEKARLEKERSRLEETTAMLSTNATPSTSKEVVKVEKKSNAEEKLEKVEDDDDEKMEITDDLVSTFLNISFFDEEAKKANVFVLPKPFQPWACTIKHISVMYGISSELLCLPMSVKVTDNSCNV